MRNKTRLGALLLTMALLIVMLSIGIGATAEPVVTDTPSTARPVLDFSYLPKDQVLTETEGIRPLYSSEQVDEDLVVKAESRSGKDYLHYDVLTQEWCSGKYVDLLVAKDGGKAVTDWSGATTVWFYVETEGTVYCDLLLGVDNRSVELVSGRADANIICSINTQDGSIKLTSIARDTAVEVPGYKSKKRLNTAFKFGSKDGDIAKGAELAMKTVNRNFQMNIERYVVVNIHGLADIIEALGGVDMELTKGEAQAINYELHVKEPMDDVQRDKLEVADGVQHLDGMEAVTYGRIRNLQGQNDLNRNERQRKLLEALLKKVMEDMDLTKFLNLIETALPYGKTNLTADELLSLGMTVLSGSAMQNLASGGEVVGQFGIPMEKQYGYREFNGESLVYISDKRMQTTLTAMQEFIYGQSYVK